MTAKLFEPFVTAKPDGVGLGLAVAGHSFPLLSRVTGTSIGVPVCNTDVRVITECGQEAAPGEIGELRIAGPQIIPGYWNRPAENADEHSDQRSACHSDRAEIVPVVQHAQVARCRPLDDGR